MSIEVNERRCEKIFSNGDVCNGSFNVLLLHGMGKYAWVDGTVYEGEWEKGFRHGSGTLFKLDGSLYKGHGQGTQTFSNSDVYEGFWREGNREGIGKCTWSNGDTYIGNWKAGKRAGRGVMQWVTGDLFDGTWLEGLQHGSGYRKFADGSYYFGAWSRGRRDGQGTQTFSNSDVYEGVWREGKREGIGKCTWSNGDTYIGNWKVGKMTGRGVMQCVTGELFDGIWLEGLLHGSGYRKCADGSYYFGAWSRGRRDGQGTETFSNSDVYEGFWREGKIEGIGKCTWNNGDTYIGNWKAGKMTGRGIMQWVTGDLFDGIWLEGLQHGSGYRKFANSSYYFGAWSRGREDGKGTFYPAGSKLLCHHLYSNVQPSFSPALVSSGGQPSLSPAVIRSGGRNRSRSKKNCLTGWSIMNCFRRSGRISPRTDSLNGSPDSGDSVGNMPLQENAFSYPCSSADAQNDGGAVYDREYMQGVLIMERIRNPDLGMSDKSKGKHKPGSKANGPCQTIYNGYKGYFLMLNLQLGIRCTKDAELQLPEEETARRVEANRKRVESLNSDDVKLEIQLRIEEGRKKLFDEIAIQPEKGKDAELKLPEGETARRVEANRKRVDGCLNSEDFELEIQRQIEEGRKKLFVEIAIQSEEKKPPEDETARRVEAIRKGVEGSLNSEDFRLEMQRRIEEGRKKLFDEIAIQLEKETEAALAEARQKVIGFPTQ